MNAAVDGVIVVEIVKVELTVEAEEIGSPHG